MFLYKMKEDKKRYRNQKYEGSNHHPRIAKLMPRRINGQVAEGMLLGPRLNATSTILKCGITKHKTLLGKHHSWAVTVAITVMIDR